MARPWLSNTGKIRGPLAHAQPRNNITHGQHAGGAFPGPTGGRKMGPFLLQAIKLHAIKAKTTALRKDLDRGEFKDDATPLLSPC